MKRRIICGVLCLAIILSLGTAASCKPDDDTPTGSGSAGVFTPDDKNITVWGGFGDDWWEAFQRENPDMKIDYSTPTENSIASLAVAINAGTQPDAFYTSNAAAAPLGEAVTKDYLLPLDEYFNRDPSYKLADLPSWYKMFASFPDNSGTEHIYGVYTDVSVACLVWNKKLFAENDMDPEKPPTTWSEMQTMATKLNKTDANGMLTQAGFLDFRFWYQHWRLTYGTNYQNPITGKPNFDTPEMVNVMEFLKSFPDKFGGQKMIPEDGVVSWERGNVGMGVADIGYGQKMANDFAAGMAPLPRPDDKEGANKSVNEVSGYAWQWYGIPKGCKNPDGGWLFCRWAVTRGSSSVQERSAQDNPEKWVPVYLAHKPTKQAAFDMYLDEVNDNTKYMLEEREKMMDKITLARPVNGPINSKWESVLENSCSRIIDGSDTVTDGLVEIQELGEQYFADYYKDLGVAAPAD